MTYNPYSLEGKTILVTGASSGIGCATAIECSKMGARVIITARNEERLKNTFQQLEDQTRGHLMFVADMTQEECIDDLVGIIPNIDGCVNNAGISLNLPIQFIKKNDLTDILNINTVSPILLTQKLIKKKRVNKFGSLVFTSSISGNNTVTYAHAMYSTSKCAITGFMRNAALDLAPKNIRCNAVHPGMINTPMVHSGKYSNEQLEKDKDNYPLKRFGEPKEVAYAIIYLLSDAAAWVTGHSIVIDGGLTLK